MLSTWASNSFIIGSLLGVISNNPTYLLLGFGFERAALCVNDNKYVISFTEWIGYPPLFK